MDIDPGEGPPYRGQIYPKERKRRFVPSANTRLFGYIVWAVLIVIGIRLGYDAITDKTLVGFFMLGIYLVFSSFGA